MTKRLIEYRHLQMACHVRNQLNSFIQKIPSTSRELISREDCANIKAFQYIAAVAKLITRL